MEISEMKAEIRMQEMQKFIQARMESGLSVSEWCQQNNFSEGSYYYWLRKIREKAIAEGDSRNEIIQVPITVPKSPENKRNPVKLKYKGNELEIPSGTVTTDILAILCAVKSC